MIHHLVQVLVILLTSLRLATLVDVDATETLRLKSVVHVGVHVRRVPRHRRVGILDTLWYLTQVLLHKLVTSLPAQALRHAR